MPVSFFALTQRSIQCTNRIQIEAHRLEDAALQLK